MLIRIFQKSGRECCEDVSRQVNADNREQMCPEWWDNNS